MSFEQAIYLSGDSYPRDAHIEAAIQGRLSHAFRRWWTQQDMLVRGHGGLMETNIARRLEILQRLLPDSALTRQTVLFGRSSGARVATLFARQQPVKAVVCIGYPFRRPDHDPEPERYEHLADIGVPVLILQGARDGYGDVSACRSYALSAHVRLTFLDCDHDLRLGEDAWNNVAARVRRFLANDRRVLAENPAPAVLTMP